MKILVTGGLGLLAPHTVVEYKMKDLKLLIDDLSNTPLKVWMV
jgi:UDP-glucose 4-epimerase